VATAHLVGIFPRSEELVAATRAYERSRYDEAALDRLFAEEARRVVALQVEAGLDYVTDGLLRWQDLLRPLSEGVDGMHPGPVTRWFDNNTFYRRPVIGGWLPPMGEVVLRYVDRDALAGHRWKAILPAPWTFALLAEDHYYADEEALLLDVADMIRSAAVALVEAGCAYVQFSDPVLVARPREGAVDRAGRALARVVEGLGVRTAVHTCFGDVAPVLPALLEWPVDEVGFDLFAATMDRLEGRAGSKTVLVGALDGRNSLLEDPVRTAETVQRVADRLGAERVGVVPSCDLEFLPWPVAAEKVRRLGEVKRRLAPVPVA
jgi:5-methyltetrahydropteroyltriglutamate--homocysteine methyltransferase